MFYLGDTLNGALSDNNANDDHIHSLEASKQVLMDRIIKLQKINVKRAEKLDFLEEHTQTLVEELQKKTKIIQNYILNQNFGALACNERDRNKVRIFCQLYFTSQCIEKCKIILLGV